MIQRIQSVYLLIAALLLGYVVFFGGLDAGEAAQHLPWYAFAATASGVAAVVVAVGAIFLYRNREKQVKLTLAAQMMTLLFAIIIYGGLFLTGEYGLLTGPDQLGRLLVLILPVIAYVLLYSAKKAIRKDINLVKSMDRLR